MTSIYFYLMQMMAVDLNYFHHPVVEKLPLQNEESSNSKQDRAKGSSAPQKANAPVRKPDDVEKQISEEIYSNLKYIRVPWNITSKEGPEQAPVKTPAQEACKVCIANAF